MTVPALPPATPEPPAPQVPTVAPPEPPPVPDPAELARVIVGWVTTHAGVLATAATVLVIGAVTVAIARRRARRQLHAGARVFVVIPPADLEPATAVAGGRRLWRALTTLAPDRRWRPRLASVPHIGLEHHLAGGEITTLLWVPGPIPAARVVAAVRAAWPGSHAAAIDEPPLPGTGACHGASVGTSRPGHLPLRMPEQADPAGDPLRELESLADDLGGDERVVVQILARPLSGRRLRRHRAAVARTQLGKPARSSPMVALATGVARAMLDLATGGSSARASRTEPSGFDAARADRLAAIRHKATDPAWDVALRYLTHAGTDVRARTLVDAVFAVFAQLSGPHNSLRRHRLARPRGTVAARTLRHGSVLSASELAWLAHPACRTPELSGGTARRVPAPPEALGLDESDPA